VPCRVREEDSCPAWLGRGNVPSRVRVRETCPAGLGRG